jgi:hypothetical protein
MDHMATAHTEHTASGSAEVGGLAVAASGLLLSPDRTRFQPSHATEFTFRILDHTGEPVTSFVEQHERAMHLIVVRHDLAGFQHLHPTMQVDGTWTTGLTLPSAGVWRAFADFATDRGAATLGVDLFAPGQFDPVELSAPTSSAATDGYEVTVHPAGLIAGQVSELVFQVARDGQPVRDLEPYLGARGHLVALREGDLGFLHVHPNDTATPGDSIEFSAALPSPGRYRLFLQFQHQDVVRTVAFTLEAPVHAGVDTGYSSQ